MAPVAMLKFRMEQKWQINIEKNMQSNISTKSGSKRTLVKMF
jgi:hypothetical protein